MRLEQRGCLPTWSARAANSDPARSKVARALTALFNQTLDEQTAREASMADEIFAIPSFEALRAEAAKSSALQGVELLAAILGVDFMFEAEPIDFLRMSLRDDSAEIDGVLQADLAKVVAAMHYYGIGVTVSRQTAAAVLLLSEADIDKSTLAGFVARDLAAGEAGELQAQIERWNPRK